MYKKSFYLKWEVWNNAFSYKDRKNKKLYVPSLLEAGINDIEIQVDESKIAFEDYDFKGNLSTNLWLKNFYKIKWKDKYIYLFDNHNHAFYFWYLARKEWLIWDENILVHIDEHADTRDCSQYLLKPDSYNLEQVFKYTNEILNVWNYIVPAQKEWLIKDVVQIRNESNLLDYFGGGESNKGQTQGLPLQVYSNDNIILNLDLDFFQKDLDFIDYELKKKVILDVANKAKVITVASSPFFIQQDLAIKVFKDIFK